MIKNLDATLTEIKKAFVEVNKWMFEGKLDEPILIVQSSSRAKANALGWFTLGKVWRNKETGQTFHEITICAEALNQPMYVILEVLVHEMVHYWCKIHGIQNCSKSQYHNKNFKAAAEKFLLICEDKPHPKYGYAFTKPSQKLLMFFDRMDLDEEAFDIAMDDNEGKKKESSQRHVYLCDGCEKTFKTVCLLTSATCAACNGTFLPKP